MKKTDSRVLPRIRFAWTHIVSNGVAAVALAALAGCATENAATSPAPAAPAADSASSVAGAPRRDWRFASVVEHARTARPEGLSGITKVEGASYLSIEDRGGRLWTLNVSFDATGRVSGCAIPTHVVLEGVVDGEGCAWDPLRKTVWVSDEMGPRIGEYDVATGKRLGELALTDDFRKIRTNLGPEGLTISPDGLTLWTCPEETVTDDGATASPTNGALVRLHRYVREKGADAWRAVEEIPYRTDPMGGRPYHNIRSSGVAGLCALSDGTLLVLEREMSVKDRILPFPSFRLRLYAVRPGEAKRLVLSRDTGLANYEGVCLVAETSDRARLLLVSDGEGLAAKTLMSVDLVR
jgi:hypothetical protein